MGVKLNAKVCRKFTWRLLAAAMAALFLALGQAVAQPANQSAAAPVEYQLDLRSMRTHEIQVLMTVPHAPPGLEIQFPAWNALYQIRDFVRHVEDVRASCDGRPAKLRRLDLETWASKTGPCSRLEVRYSVFASQEGPFGTVLNEQHSFINPAMVLFYLPRERRRAVEVSFKLPAQWKLATLLRAGSTPGEYEAANYDALADSPALAGNFSEYDYRQSGAEYRVIVDADPGDYSSSQLLAALKKITGTETATMRDVPFHRYTFFFEFPSQGGGGMEHRDGTAISFPVSDLASNWLGLEAVAAHEFFHLWNVKRIRPAGLEPVDYIHGNDTSDLWFSEGVTSTYEDLTLVRAGLDTPQQFYRRFAGQIARLQARPARLFQSVEQSGRAAWLEKYRDYFRPQRSISYYNKGEILGFLLDLAIRHASGNRHSLDDLMRRLNDDFAKRGRFFTDRDLRRMVRELAPGFDVDAFFRNYITGTEELDYNRYLGYAGLRLVSGSAQQASLGFQAEHGFTGPVVVVSVDPESNAGRAGLRSGDVLLEMNGLPLQGLPEDYLQGTGGGQRVKFKVSRHGRLLDISFKTQKGRATAYRIEEIPGAGPEQLRIRQGWLEGKTD